MHSYFLFWRQLVAIIYLLVYGFVPFCLDDRDDDNSQARLQPRILHSTDVLW